MAPAKTTPLRRNGEDKGDLATEILETALELAEERGWQAVRMRDIADRLGIRHHQVLDHYRDLDGVADAWFLRGWRAMLAPKPADFDTWPGARRIEYCMLAWFDAMAEHREVTVEMLRGKMHASHMHHWVPMVFNLSRTIHWLREAANLQAAYGSRRAQTEEVGLTALFTATLWVWSRDDSPAQQRTRRFLRQRLDRADRAMIRIWGEGRPPGAGTVLAEPDEDAADLRQPH